MKVVLTGATGYIGAELLNQLAQHPEVTSVVVLSRRQLQQTPASPKVAVVIVDDFLNYGPAVLQAIAGAQACVWCVLGKPWIPNSEVARTVSIGYTMTAARAFLAESAAATTAVAQPGGRQVFRFVYMNGIAAERDQTKRLWYLGEYRRIRGQVENELLALADANRDVLEAYMMRPGMVTGTAFSVVDLAYKLALPSVGIVELAKLTVETALHGNKEGHTTIDNAEIVAEGRKFL
ncbi:hypothetical protein B0T26DRAFT_644331 [Lasiosphaeria miniovina]|uniref:NAD(P)-binding domain-containing protein n=1 Tax=Lasiosphaeria miniovina TaxID=1954250 RepID=A0AA40ATM5_9PEZI|nr:uncharacterized protein B0T26DRAFT_644331 [Lasiosphaeria miniovina]KAK0721794.1 hypothetical protein B0T26DRAFT_644331 [Lasiosphaeria miniovina]